MFKHSAQSLLVAVALLGCFGFTDCPSYHTVRVPATDTVKPVITAGVYDHPSSTYLDIQATDAKMPRAIWYDAGYREDLRVFGSATDEGGIKLLTFDLYTDYTCCWLDSSGNKLCHKNNNLAHDVEKEAQSGTVGSSVSNGIYLGAKFTPKAFLTAKCGADAAYYSKMSQRFKIIATDFKGNTTTSLTHYIHYN